MSFLLHVLTLGSLHLYGALGYNLVFGRGKILHFGLGATSIAAGYTLWTLFLRFHVPFSLALIAALLAVILVSILFTWLSIRLPGDAFGVMSIALHLTFLSIVLNWQSVTRGALGFSGVPRGILPSSVGGYALLTGVIAICYAFFVFCIDRSAIGRSLSALAEHPWHAESLGIRRWVVYLTAFLVLGIGTLIGDVLFPPFFHLLSPSDYGFPVLIFFVTIVVAGRPGNFFGCIISTYCITFLKEGIRFVKIPLLTNAGWSMSSIPSDWKGPANLLLFGIILFTAAWLQRDTMFPKQRSV